LFPNLPPNVFVTAPVMDRLPDELIIMPDGPPPPSKPPVQLMVPSTANETPYEDVWRKRFPASRIVPFEWTRLFDVQVSDPPEILRVALPELPSCKLATCAVSFRSTSFVVLGMTTS
jgi:hypothetical protein